MLFSVNYKSTHKQEADEVRCPCNQLGLIFDFIKNNPNKRYVIQNPREQDFKKAIEQIDYVREVADDYTIECDDVSILLLFINENVNTYLKFPVTDWESFDNLYRLGASDIYIDGPLCFQMDKIMAAKKETSINIRVSPTVSPSASLSERSPHTFFIRPEDLHLYSAIDIIDFKETDQEREDALFTIYKRGTFNYDLGELIKGLTPNINNILLQDHFAQYRLVCGQKCKVPGRGCHYCDNAFLVMQNAIEVAKLEKKK